MADAKEKDEKKAARETVFKVSVKIDLLVTGTADDVPGAVEAAEESVRFEPVEGVTATGVTIKIHSEAGA